MIQFTTETNTALVSDNPLIPSEKVQLIKYINVVIEQYRFDLSKNTNNEILIALIKLYQTFAICKEEGQSCIFHHVNNSEKAVTGVMLYIADTKESLLHISILSVFGETYNDCITEDLKPIDLDMIKYYMNSIVSKEEIVRNVVLFIKQIMQVIPNHIPYIFMGEHQEIPDDRLIFINEYTRHSIVIIITPLTIISKLIDRKEFDLHYNFSNLLN